MFTSAARQWPSRLNRSQTMNRRLFLRSGSAAAVTAALAACGGGGGGSAGSGGTGSMAAGSAMADTATGVTTAPAAPAAAQQASASGLPSRILGCYFTGWDTAYKITDVPSDFNVIYLFHCKPVGGHGGDGSFMFEFSGDVTAAQVQAVRSRGQKVILTVGGAGAGFAWDSRAKSTNFVNSFKAIVASLGGVDGIDYNNYEGSVIHNGNYAVVSGEMIWISQQLKAAYGAGFAVTSPAQPNDPLQQQLMVDMQKAGVLTYAAPQYYDWSGFNAPGFISTRTGTWVGLLGEQATAVGLSAGYSDGPSLDDCIREWNVIKKNYPNVRGMFCWSAQHNLRAGNGWGSTMRGLLG
jgi:hypothetical protein